MSSKAKGNPAFEEALDDIHTRFILNLPDEELSSAPRIFFQVGMTCARSPSLRAGVVACTLCLHSLTA